jgi:sugar phosphate permease
MEMSGSRPLEMSVSNDGFLLHPLVSSWGTVPTGISIALVGMLIFGPDVLPASVAVVKAVTPEHAGRAAGYVSGMGSFGQMVSPALVAYFTRLFGWNSISSIFVVCSLLAASLLAMRWNSRIARNLIPQFPPQLVNSMGKLPRQS